MSIFNFLELWQLPLPAPPTRVSPCYGHCTRPCPGLFVLIVHIPVLHVLPGSCGALCLSAVSWKRETWFPLPYPGFGGSKLIDRLVDRSAEWMSGCDADAVQNVSVSASRFWLKPPQSAVLVKTHAGTVYGGRPQHKELFKRQIVHM